MYKLPTKRLLIVLGSILLLVGVAFVCGTWSNPAKITMEKYDLIKMGMSREKVINIVGVQPGDHASGPVTYPNPFPDVTEGDLEADTCTAWVGDEVEILVSFGDSDGRETVTAKAYWRVERQEQGALGDLVWRAKKVWWTLFPPQQ
jgi:hypothetical protein